MAYCNTLQPSKHDLRTVYNEEFFRNAEAKDSGETLYVQVRWVVLYQNDQQKIDIRRIQDCHKALNMIYAGENVSELEMVPNTTNNPWKPLIGNPNIQFLPLDSTKVTAEYIATSSTLDGTSPVTDAAARGKRVNGVLNIYVGNSGSGGILGQAELSNNVVYVLYSSVGGFEVRGSLDGYDLGKTLAHEVGHALSLPHVFSDDVCDGDKPYPDIPESIRPNFTTELTQTSNGAWEQINDNRDRDRKNNFATNSSCLKYESKNGTQTAPNDMGINIMDYGKDSVSIMFSKSQATMMRAFLTSEQNTMLALKTADAEPASYEVTATEAAVDSATKAATTALWVYILVGVLGGLLLIGLGWFLYVKYVRVNRVTIRTH